MHSRPELQAFRSSNFRRECMQPCDGPYVESKEIEIREMAGYA
jgi:hypothetical protein